MSRRALRSLAAAGAMAAVTQMAFSFMTERGIEPPTEKLTDARKAEAHRMIRRSNLRGNARMFAHAIVREANEDGVAVLSHGDLADVAGCSARTSKRRVPDRIEGAWATVIRPPIYANSRRPGQPGQLVFVWAPRADELRDAKPRDRGPRTQRTQRYRDEIDRFVSDPEGRLPAPPAARPAPPVSPPSAPPSAEDRELVALRLAELDRLLPSDVWTSAGYMDELFSIAEDAGKTAPHIGGAAEGLARVVRARARDGKRTTPGWAQEQLRAFIPTQLRNKVAKRVPVERTPAAAAAPPPAHAPPVAPAAPGISHAALGRAHLGLDLDASAASARKALAAIARPTPGVAPTSPSTPAVKPLPPDPEKPPD